jgi:hypothetical protein
MRSRQRLEGSLSGGGGENAWAADNELRRQLPLPHAAHLVAIPTVVADHLRAFVRDMLHNSGQKVGGGENLEVAVDLGIPIIVGPIPPP